MLTIIRAFLIVLSMTFVVGTLKMVVENGLKEDEKFGKWPLIVMIFYFGTVAIYEGPC